MGQKYKWSKRLPAVPKQIGVKGQVRIRPISAHMDKITDKFVVSGGGKKHVVVGDRLEAIRVANARIRVREKRKQQKRRKK